MKFLESLGRILAMLCFFIIAAGFFGLALEEMETFNRILAYLLFCISGMFAGAGFVIGCAQPNKNKY